jgi:hypothetical protein
VRVQAQIAAKKDKRAAAESFGALYSVRIAEDSAFHVRPRIEETADG